MVKLTKSESARYQLIGEIIGAIARYVVFVIICLLAYQVYVSHL